MKTKRWIAMVAVVFGLGLIIPASAQAHRTYWHYVKDNIRDTKDGGQCGHPTGWRCAGGWVIDLYYGGDGNPAVGYHSWQFNIVFLEQSTLSGTIRCVRSIDRWYHESFGEHYFRTSC